MGQKFDATSDELVRDAITLAKNMRNNGASIEMIESRLAKRGFNPPAIKAVLSQIPSEEPNNIIVGRDESTGARMVVVFFGLLICFAGGFFVVGNRTGIAPSVPFFGFALMVLGGVIMNIGRK